MNPGDSSRRKRRILLFLFSILVPMAVLITFAFRIVRQDAELAETRAADNRREALAEVAGDLLAELEDIKLQEARRWTLESGSIVPDRIADSPIVFAAPIIQNRVSLPWEVGRNRVPLSSSFSEYKLEAEAQEFVRGDPEAALDALRGALRSAETAHETCAARLWIGRNLLNTDRTQEASSVYRSMLEECRDVTDGGGIGFDLYAAERLISTGLDVRLAEEHVVEAARVIRWRPPTESYLIRSLFDGIPGPDAEHLASDLSSEINRLEQMVMLANEFPQLGQLDFPFRRGLGNSTWLAWGHEPWFLTVVSPAQFESPIVMAVSSEEVLPPGAGVISSDPALGVPLGESFVDAYLVLPDDRFVPARAWPVWFYGIGIALIVGVTAFAGHLLLRDVNREVETAQMRSQFVASVSHELKTPLTSIRMFAETLAAKRFNSERQQSDYLETIVNESERLSRLVDNVLDFSRIERGKKIFRMEAVPLAKVVESVARTMQYPLAQQGFELSISVDEDPPSLTGDADALEQAILNLLTNAMKYSADSRQVELRLKRQDSDAVIEVTDHGLGMTREDKARVFEEFYRVRSVELDRIAGAGLGLTIAAHIVEAHGGRLDVASVPGEGSTFSVRLPIQTNEDTV